LQLRVFYGVPSRATLRDQTAVPTYQALTTAHNWPEITAVFKPGAKLRQFTYMIDFYEAAHRFQEDGEVSVR
jgi:hypothetical protein